MAFEHPGDGALDYLPCRYGKSRLLFRGPKKSLQGRYAVFFGGTETYGKFIEYPFADLVGGALDFPTINMGCVNAGIDVYARDQPLMQIADRADVAVIQVMGAQNMSNRFYSVHPRRNDRFIGPSALMQTIYREVDFTDYAFTRHMLQALRDRCERRFGLVVEELKAAWVARMRTWMESMACRKVLLWLSEREPVEEDCALDPLFVDRRMLEQIRPYVDDIVEVVRLPAMNDLHTEGMVFSELEAQAAQQTPGVAVHIEAAAALVPVLEALIDRAGEGAQG